MKGIMDESVIIDDGLIMSGYVKRINEERVEEEGGE